MRPNIRPINAAIAMALGTVMVVTAAQAAGTVQVSYVLPDNFTDVGRSPSDVQASLNQLTRHFEALARRHLSDGQRLTIEVLDVDLAGEMRQFRRAEIRVLRGQADWPRIKLRYTLESPGQAARKGEHDIPDMSYLHRLGGYAANQPLGHELRMLEAWFSEQFDAAAKRYLN